MHRLVIKPDEPELFYLVTGVGIYRSADGGETYDHLMRRGERIGYPDFAFLDPDDDRTLYMGGAHTSPGTWRKSRMARACVMRSTDEGKNWTEVNNGLPDPIAASIEAMTQHLWDGGMMLVAGTATGEVFVTENGGTSWDQVPDLVSPVAKDHHYLAFLPEPEQKEALARLRA